jgi:hypothetical protein
VDGQPRRVQRSHLLCRKSNKCFSKTCKPVNLLRDEFMRTVNIGQANEQDMRVTDFWEQRYLPFLRDQMKPSMVNGYLQIWNQHLNQLVIALSFFVGLRRGENAGLRWEGIFCLCAHRATLRVSAFRSRLIVILRPRQSTIGDTLAS